MFEACPRVTHAAEQQQPADLDELVVDVGVAGGHAGAQAVDDRAHLAVQRVDDLARSLPLVEGVVEAEGGHEAEQQREGREQLVVLVLLQPVEQLVVVEHRQAHRKRQHNQRAHRRQVQGRGAAVRTVEGDSEEVARLVVDRHRAAPIFVPRAATHGADRPAAGARDGEREGGTRSHGHRIATHVTRAYHRVGLLK